MKKTSTGKMGLLANLNHGRHDSAGELTPAGANGGKEGGRIPKFSKPDWFTRRAWREAPLTCLNQVLRLGCVLLTLAAPFYLLWYDAAVVDTLAAGGRNASRSQSDATGASPAAGEGQDASEAEADAEEAGEDWIDQEFSSSADSMMNAAVTEEEDSDSASTAAEQVSVTTLALPQPTVVATPLSPYAAIAARRPFFRTGVAAQASAPLGAGEATDLTQRYLVVGILMGQTPRAMIRDRGSNSAMVVAKGQSLNGYRVQEILADRVILELNGQVVELKM
ncbi:MAG: hypothetical protein ONB53_21940 [candidate division KSB1 bacterium]|nr:hypothetical protein [candidate division KSB1 bacterium]MDZ7300436.1 hypothetical protein [candidate division KSB1 bacterium]MDZ7308715.1 hypothetical protein [candidate division KSB1 bacterium]MDZ7351462.1 hypothetical protein [candidate division KSB1 bacterium]MDZ7355821.1 hypothetical protein [candidate division KSB1 bacterium]